MFRELKEYQDIIKLYQNNVYQSEEDIIKEAFASEEFTEEEAAFIEENFDALIEEVIAEEEESLSEQMTGRQRGKALRQKADEIISDIRKPAAKTTKVSSKAIQGKPAGVVGKFKSALSKVGSKIGNVAKTAVKTGTAPLKSSQGAGKMVGKGAKLLSKMGPAGKAAAVATLAGGAIAAGLAARNKNKVTKQVDKYVEKNKGSKPIRKIDPAPFNKREKAEPVKSATASEPVVSDKPKPKLVKFKGKMVRSDNQKYLQRQDQLARTKAMFDKRKAEGKTIQQVKDENKASMRAKAAERNAAFKAKRAAKSGNAKPEAQAKPVEKPAATPSGDKLKAGSFGISEKGKKQAAANRAEVAKKNTVPSGSFGISEKGKKQAEANKKEVAMRPTNTGNARKDNFNKKINTLKNKKKYGGTGNPITIGDKTFKPGDKGYKDAFNTVSSAVSKSMQKNSYEPDIDAYDLVLEYLISTEQVATIEEANYVMIEMDSKTIQAIVEEQKKNIDEGLASMALKTGLAVGGAVLAKKGLDKAKQKFDNFINKKRDEAGGGNTRPGADKIYFGDKKKK